jgi:dihydrofolate reductase
MVVAVAQNRVIGSHGRLPWRLASDLQHFRALTLGKPVIMGRKTFTAMGKPLPGRDNIVITRDRTFAPAGVHSVPDLAAALTLARCLAKKHDAAEIMVIGGGEIYRAALGAADRIYLTRVHARPAGEVSFPPLDPALWQETSRRAMPQGPRDDHAADFLVFDRRR